MSNSTIVTTTASTSSTHTTLTTTTSTSSTSTSSTSTTTPPVAAAETTTSSTSTTEAAVAGASTVTVEPSTTEVVTSVVEGSATPVSTVLYTSVVTASSTGDGTTQAAVTTVVMTTVISSTASETSSSSKTSSSTSTTSSAAASLQNTGDSSSSSGGLSEGGKTAVAVVVPVVVVALLVLAGLLFWRRRKQKKSAQEERRKEVEDYGFNPNEDPTLPVGVASASEMTEDGNGYRGWGSSALGNRKASTTISGGHTAGQLSDTGSNPGGYAQSSPSDGHSGDALVTGNRRDTIGSADDLAALGAAPVAGSHRNHDIHRGPSNASSSYSAGGHSDDGLPSIAQTYSSPQDYGNGAYGYSQHGPYGNGTYGGTADAGMPVVRDVSARRNTRIEAGGAYQQGNSGISQNF